MDCKFFQAPPPPPISLRYISEPASLITGNAAEDRVSVPNPSKIRNAELTALNTKTLKIPCSPFAQIDVFPPWTLPSMKDDSTYAEPKRGREDAL